MNLQQQDNTGNLLGILPITQQDSIDTIENNQYFKTYNIYFIPFLLIIKWIFFGVMIIFYNSDTIDDSTYDNYDLFWFSIFQQCDDCSDLRLQCWRLLTYSMLHTDVYHLILNTISFLIFGGILEYFIGIVSILVIFFSSVIFSAISTAYCSPYSIIVGSSGGAYGMLGGWFGSSIVNWNIFNRISKLAITFMFILVIGISLLDYYYNRDDRTAYYVHLVGFIYGFSVSICIVKQDCKVDYFKYIKLLNNLVLLTMSCVLMYEYITLNNSKDIRYINKCCYIGEVSLKI